MRKAIVSLFTGILLLFVSVNIGAASPDDFFNLILSAQGSWNNITYSTTGPIWFSGELFEEADSFSIHVRTPGAFGIPDTMDYTASGVYVVYEDSALLAVTDPFPGLLTVQGDSIFGVFTVESLGIVFSVTGIYTPTTMHLEYNMAGAFSATGILDIEATGSTRVVSEKSERPSSFALSQNYPNPFNPSTTIQFTIPQAAHVRLAVYDLLGHEVALLADQNFAAGSYALSFDGRNLASGVYFYEIRSGGWKTVRKMILTE